MYTLAKLVYSLYKKLGKFLHYYKMKSEKKQEKYVYGIGREKVLSKVKIIKDTHSFCKIFFVW